MTETPVAHMDVLGIPVSLVNMTSAVEVVTTWAREKSVRKIFLRDVHGLMRAVENEEFMELHKQADLVMPDGMPLTWIGYMRGYGREIGRTPGADVVDEVCKQSTVYNLSHYFYGGKPGVAAKMAQVLCERHRGLKVAGFNSPPMRELPLESPLSEEEIFEIELINQSGANYIWVGISTPKQEIWMMRAAPYLHRGVIFGVGAAFDFHAGLVKRAPVWMRKSGLEWLHRFASEPRRLWRRYLIMAPKFVWLMAIQGFRR